VNRLKSISFRQLRALESIAYHQGLKPAAVALNLTVPAVHSQLAQLEQSVGVPLFDRGTRGFVLTSEGEVLLRAFITSQNELGRALAHIDSLRKGEAGALTLGVVSTGKYFAPSLIGRFKALYPDIQITLRVGNRRRTIEALERKEIDMAIMGRPPRQPVVDARPIGDHPHVFIAPPDHPLVTGQVPHPDDILRETIIAREVGSGTRILMSRYLDLISPGATYDLMEMDSNETIKQAVKAGLGISIISYHTVFEEIEAGRLGMIRTQEFPIMRTWYLLKLQEHVYSGAAQVFSDFVLSQQGEFLPALPKLD